MLTVTCDFCGRRSHDIMDQNGMDITLAEDKVRHLNLCMDCHRIAIMTNKQAVMAIMRGDFRHGN